MKFTRSFKHILGSSLLALVVLAGMAPIARAEVLPVPFDYSNDFNDYGKQPNLCPPANPKGICAAVAAIKPK